MKKIILLVLLFSTFFTLGVDAYSLSNVLKNTQKYEKEFQKKLDLSRFETATLEKLKKQIETMITSLEKNTTKSNSDLEIIL
jgi:septal ring factor EnvC (AmiA/AmiB activator)